VDVQPHVMTQSVDKIFAQRLTVQVFAVGVDVIVGNLEKRIGAGAALQRGLA
jgi:hypothetical protein